MLPIPEWISPKEQTVRIGKKFWRVPRLWALSVDLPVLEIPLQHLTVDYYYKNLSLRQLVMHMKVATAESPQDFPIILDENGIVMDGRHRILKALWENAHTIKAVRFSRNPEPDREE